MQLTHGTVKTIYIYMHNFTQNVSAIIMSLIEAHYKLKLIYNHKVGALNQSSRGDFIDSTSPAFNNKGRVCPYAYLIKDIVSVYSRPDVTKKKKS